MTGLSLSLKDVELEREKANMRVEAVEKRLQEISESQESQISSASAELVRTVQLVESEIKQKMLQLRQLLDETKAVKQNQGERVAALEARMDEAEQERIKVQAMVD